MSVTFCFMTPCIATILSRLQSSHLRKQRFWWSANLGAKYCLLTLINLYYKIGPTNLSYARNAWRRGIQIHNIPGDRAGLNPPIIWVGIITVACKRKQAEPVALQKTNMAVDERCVLSSRSITSIRLCLHVRCEEGQVECVRVFNSRHSLLLAEDGVSFAFSLSFSSSQEKGILCSVSHEQDNEITFRCVSKMSLWYRHWLWSYWS